MQVSKLILIIAVNRCRGFTKSTKDGAEHCKVFLEEGVELIEKGHTALNSDHKLCVRLFNVFLFFDLRIELEELKV